jgi:hypothetical protein
MLVEVGPLLILILRATNSLSLFHVTDFEFILLHFREAEETINDDLNKFWIYYSCKSLSPLH